MKVEAPTGVGLAPGGRDQDQGGALGRIVTGSGLHLLERTVRPAPHVEVRLSVGGLVVLLHRRVQRLLHREVGDLLRGCGREGCCDDGQQGCLGQVHALRSPLRFLSLSIIRSTSREAHETPSDRRMGFYNAFIGNILRMTSSPGGAVVARGPGLL